MKKLFILVLMVLVGVSLSFQNVKADEARTIKHNFRVVTANTVVSAQGVVLYKVTGYANASNAVYGIYNAATVGAATATTCAVENGEATQYDGFPLVDFGNDGLVLDSGLTILVSGAYVTVEYL